MNKERLLFGVTRLKNGQFMVQDVYLGSDSVNSKMVGVYDTVREANMWYRYYAPNNVTVR